MTAFVNCSGMSGTGSVSSTSEMSAGCTLATATLRAPRTINEATRLINALPKPLTLPCFLENLPRPLNVYAINTSFSAQPAGGADNPRVLIMTGDLVLTVSPTGAGKNLLEFGQLLNLNETIKGELTFPVTSVLPTSAPYDQILDTGGTSCRLCHAGERGMAGLGGNAYASGLVRPNAFYRENSTRLRTVAVQCDKSADPYRCEMMNSIFVIGKAQDSNFP